jgi:hypothetical protein
VFHLLNSSLTKRKKVMDYFERVTEYVKVKKVFFATVLPCCEAEIAS